MSHAATGSPSYGKLLPVVFILTLLSLECALLRGGRCLRRSLTRTVAGASALRVGNASGAHVTTRALASAPGAPNN